MVNISTEKSNSNFLREHKIEYYNSIPSKIYYKYDEGSNYVLKKEFIIDEFGNINTAQNIPNDDGLITSFIWNSNKSYPVIKAENVELSALQTAVSSSMNYVSGYSDFETFVDALVGKMHSGISNKRDLWSDFNIALRNSLSNIPIYTYTYDPLVGMTSQTDPAGITTYYEYDNFNRLMEVENTDEKLTGYYEYNYKLFPELSVSPSSLSYTSSASGKTAAITANQAWMTSDNQSWITVSPRVEMMIRTSLLAFLQTVALLQEMVQ